MARSVELELTDRHAALAPPRQACHRAREPSGRDTHIKVRGVRRERLQHVEEMEPQNAPI
ncbi:hypothetical protein ABT010_16925 [Streptomyces sp. NPDC002668]|uniref:hypothetical protein n=1 Tax=Streptomyces sp. NPDC002668 TaxID=3154422 RepID=UPI003321C094